MLKWIGRLALGIFLTTMMGACRSSDGEKSARPAEPVKQTTTSAASPAAQSPQQSVHIADYFPLKKGDEWVYEGVVKAQTDGSKIHRGKFRVTMRVVDEVRNPGNDGVSLFVMSGHPSDAGWPDKIDESAVNVPDKNVYGYLVIGNNIYRVDETNLPKVREEVASGKDISELPGEGSLEFELPFHDGQQFGNTAVVPFEDGDYSWSVTAVKDRKRASNTATAKTPKYKLRFNTRSDTTEMVFEPYLGICRWEYDHHGTVCDIDMKLVSFTVHTRKTP